MNEVTKIHLGRQAFTISVDAHHQLRSYLDAIKIQVKDKDVVDEIELRMAELLTEHGINANKVILPTDINFLKQQLGHPKDFREDEKVETLPSQKNYDGKKLFRDTDNAIIAGVSAGLAEYFGLDTLLVRILFVFLILITAGWAILLYILLWLLVPEAKTTSDKLQMAGKPVTVDSLKEIVDNADVKGAMNRANNTLAKPINNIFRIILKVIGLLFVLFGLSNIFGLIGAESYILVHSGPLIQDNLFPVGFREHLLLDITMVVLGLISVFIILFGIAIFRRKWPIRTWVTGILIGLILIGIAVSGALIADVYPNVRDRYNSNIHTTAIVVKPFNTVNVIQGNWVNYNFVPSNKYYVTYNYYDHPNLSSIKTYVTNGTLNIDTSQFNWRRSCTEICIPDTYNLVITIYSPNAIQQMNQYNNGPNIPAYPTEPSMKMFNN